MVKEKPRYLADAERISLLLAQRKVLHANVLALEWSLKYREALGSYRQLKISLEGSSGGKIDEETLEVKSE